MNPKALFLGLSTSPQSWYRCGLPAAALGHDWACITGKPPPIGTFVGGSLEHYPDIDSYDLIIAQLPKGDEWLEAIENWKNQGKTVLFECDDFLHGVHRIKDHRFRSQFNKKVIKQYVECMKLCDGMICSTEFLAEQYKKYNPNQHVCKIGIDTRRYEVKFPKRDHIAIGWSGGTGHNTAIMPWLEAVKSCMYVNGKAGFVTMGVPYAQLIEEIYPHRTLTLPWTSLENYPYALTNFDIVIAPSHDSKYFKSKSDLRWLEASALGLPVIAGSNTYHEVEHGVTGFISDDPDEITEHLDELIYSPSLRKQLGENAREYVQKNRDFTQTSEQWRQVISKNLDK